MDDRQNKIEQNLYSANSRHEVSSIVNNKVIHSFNEKGVIIYKGPSTTEYYGPENSPFTHRK